MQSRLHGDLPNVNDFKKAVAAIGRLTRVQLTLISVIHWLSDIIF